MSEDTDNNIEKLRKLLSKKLLKEAQASEKFVDPDEMFANWLPVTMGVYSRRTFDFQPEELYRIRSMARILAVSDEVCVNIIKHYINNTVGEGVNCSVLPRDLGSDPTKLANALDDKKIKKLKDNWEAFTCHNKLNERLREWVKRVHRDGECFVRLFNAKDSFAGKKVPVIRFIDPYFICPANNARNGIVYAPNDEEKIIGYNYDSAGSIPNDTFVTAKTTSTILKPEVIIHDKRNVDFNTARGLSSFWSVFTNIRRVSKNMENVSVLTGILSAIALVRKHSQATQSKIDQFLSKNSDGRSRTNQASGKPQYAALQSAGTVIDAPVGIEYDFPAHNVKTENYIAVIDKELAQIAQAFVLPVDWLKSSNPDTPLTHGSPTVQNFMTEQAVLFEHLTDLFWRVQVLMGIDESLRFQYDVNFFGPILATANALDQARVNEIELRSGALSPQTWCSMQNRNYLQERANMIRHRETAQPNEVMPGDAGNTNVTPGQQSAGQGGDGTSKSNGSQRGGAAPKSDA